MCNEIIKLRPHHMLCMKAYEGKGYSEEFNNNMEMTIKALSKNPNQKIKVVFSLDNICSKCPNNIEGKSCTSQAHIEELDRRVVDNFNINEGEYVYSEIAKEIYENMNEEKFDNICKDCGWYNITNCKKLICSK